MIKVKLFSHLRYILDAEELELKINKDISSEDLKEKIMAIGGDKIKGIPFRIAVNQEFISSPITIHPEDEIALIPPVQGG